MEMLQYSLEELKGLGPEDIHLKEELPQVMDKFERYVRGETRIDFNLRMKRKDGSVFYTDISGFKIMLSGKAYLVGIVREVSGDQKS